MYSCMAVYWNNLKHEKFQNRCDTKYSVNEIN